MIGASLTTFFVIKKNQTVKNYLCRDFEDTTDTNNKSSLSGILNSEIIKEAFNLIKDSNSKTDEKEKINKFTDIINNLKPGNFGTSTPPLNTPINNNSTSTAIIAGPGGCKNEDECLKYCSMLDNLKECIDFVKEHGLVQ